MYKFQNVHGFTSVPSLAIANDLLVNVFRAPRPVGHQHLTLHSPSAFASAQSNLSSTRLADLPEVFPDGWLVGWWPPHSLTAHLPPPNSPQCKGAPADDGLEQRRPTTTGSRFLPAHHLHQHQHTQTLPLADLKLRLSKHHCSKHITGFQSWKPHCAIVWSWLVYVKRWM